MPRSTALLEELAQGAATTPRPPGAVGDRSACARLAQETPVIDFVNGIFAEALSRRASDIHVEPFADHFAVRLRIDGVLVTVRTAPRARFDAVCSRIKLLSGMDIGERRLPQDGRQSIRAAGQELDLRISSLPSVWGESLVLRLLGRVDRLPKLAELGVSDAQAAMLLALVDKPQRRGAGQRPDRLAARPPPSTACWSTSTTARARSSPSRTRSSSSCRAWCRCRSAATSA